MRQHLDAGGVRVEVTHISSGSVVVEFHLLIVSDLDAQEVSAVFLAALQNASRLEVVGGDTFIRGTPRPGPDGDSPGQGREAVRAQLRPVCLKEVTPLHQTVGDRWEPHLTIVTMLLFQL